MARTTMTCDAVDPGRRAAFGAAVTGRPLAESTPAVARLCSLGAPAHATPPEYGLTWTVIPDPEGNACCLEQT